MPCLCLVSRAWWVVFDYFTWFKSVIDSISVLKKKAKSFQCIICMIKDLLKWSLIHISQVCQIINTGHTSQNKPYRLLKLYNSLELPILDPDKGAIYL